MIIDTSQPGKCKACHATIYWRLEKSGKSNPYDAPKPCATCQGTGKIVIQRLIPPDLVYDCIMCDGRGRLQVSHFATCVAAAAFRKKAKR